MYLCQLDLSVCMYVRVYSNCYNVVRLRKYICLRKQLPFEVPACLPELQDSTADQLEEYLKDLH